MNTLPCSKEAEMAVIGSVLVNPSCFREIDLSADDFYFGDTKATWIAFQELSIEHHDIDYLTVMQKLAGKVDASFLTNTTYITPSSMNWDSYVSIVKDKARRRDYIKLSGDLATSAFDESKDLQEAIPGFLNKMATTATPDNAVEHIKDSLSKLYDNIQERAADPKEVWGFETGIKGFDKITGGLQTGEAIMITGEPGLGKSIIAVQMGFYLAKNGIAGAIFEMEMGNAQTLRRQLSIESGVMVRGMKSGRLDSGELVKINEGISKLESMPVFMSDSSSWTSASMRSELIRLKETSKVQWFILDYLMLLKDSYGNSEIERQNYMSIAIKDICKDLDMAGIIINSVNKQGITSGSKQIQHDMDTIINMEDSKRNTPATQDNPLVDIIFNKQREGDGSNRILTLVKKPGFPMFQEVEMGTPQFGKR